MIRHHLEGLRELASHGAITQLEEGQLAAHFFKILQTNALVRKEKQDSEEKISAILRVHGPSPLPVHGQSGMEMSLPRGDR